MLANIGFDTPENEPPNVPPRSPRSRTGITVRMACCGTGMSRSTGITVLRVVICVRVTKKLCVLPSQGEKGGGDGDTEWYPGLQIRALEFQSLSSQFPRARTSEPHRARTVIGLVRCSFTVPGKRYGEARKLKKSSQVRGKRKFASL